jgi:RHS repeat-associated protein
LGTPQQLVQKSGAKVWEGEYRAFGALVAEEGSWENRLRFRGQYNDQETNNYYNYFRDYDPSTGRYLQSDPIGLYGGLNTYNYVSGNPLIRIDPQGLIVVGSWIESPRFNLMEVGVDDWEVLSPSWSWWGYIKIIRLYGHALVFVNIDVKCQNECNEWELHNEIPVYAQGHFDTGPNL